MRWGLLACVALVALAGCGGISDAGSTPTPTRSVGDCGLGTGGVRELLATNRTVTNETAARSLATRVTNESVTIADDSPIGYGGDIRSAIRDVGGNTSTVYYADVGDNQVTLAVTGDGDVYQALVGAC